MGYTQCRLMPALQALILSNALTILLSYSLTLSLIRGNGLHPMPVYFGYFDFAQHIAFRP